MKYFEKHPIITLSIFVALMLLPGLDKMQVSIMEARDFITGREMLTDGNWIFTTMNGEARYEKPPLPTWSSAISAGIFGKGNLFGWRFPQALMVMLAGVFVFFISRKLFDDKRQALYNGLLAVTSFYVVGIIIEAPWDIYTHALMLVSIFLFLKLFETDNAGWKYVAGAGLFMGLSFLSKGPISFYGLFLPLIIAYAIVYGKRFRRNKILPVLSILLIAMAIGGWWYLYVRLGDPHTFSKIANKETGNWGEYNVKPFYYYWNFFAQSGLWTIPAFIGLLYPYMKKRVSNLKAYQLTLFWTLFSVILLSLVPEKKARYLMPTLIPLALNTGFYIEYLIHEFKNMKDKREIWPVYIEFGIPAVIGIALPVAIVFIMKQDVTHHLVLYIVSSLVFLAIGINIIRFIVKKQIDKVFLLTVGLFGSLLLFGLPLLSSDLIGKPLHPISGLKTESDVKHIKVYCYDFIAPEMIWQYGDKISMVKKDSLHFNFPKEKQFGLLVNQLEHRDSVILYSRYQLQKITTYNLNYKLQTHKGQRLINDFYMATKK